MSRVTTSTEHTMSPRRLFRPKLARAAAAAMILFSLGGAARAAEASFASPDAAADALVAAARANQPARLAQVLGPGSGKLVNSGDPVADRTDRAQFIAAFEAKHSIAPHGDQATLLIGAEDWPFPIPLRQSDGAWRFDARAGREEILNRRIGRDELETIEVSRAIVEAERDFAADSGAYASKFISSPGKHDGLYWPSAAGAAQSPLGPLVATARAQGYHGRHAPYHGYYFKILTGQGSHARGGAHDFLVKGEMIGGFALVAYPARWGDSGVMTFIVDRDGIVYEKNLGRDTERAAPALSRYDPDQSWRQVPSAAK
jgi:hypothetical protein